jgi:hypothetical protein
MITKNNTKINTIVTNRNNDSVGTNKLNNIKTDNTQGKKTTQQENNKTILRYKYKPFIYFIGNYSFIEWSCFAYMDTPKQELQTFIKNDVFKEMEIKQC